jgi:hypothetical protein
MLKNELIIFVLQDLKIKRVIMLTTNDVAKVYDTILSIPGMNETVKIDLRISRKNVLLLNSVIERGLTVKDDDKSSNLLNSVPQETLQELNALARDCLQKAGLIELSEKLTSLGSGK